jgi:hypothetical protein
MLELLMLAGYYRMISYLTNALRLPLEARGARFPLSGGLPEAGSDPAQISPV